MKKILCVLCAVVCTGMAWGIDFSMSAGGGGFIGGHFTRYTLNADGAVSGVKNNVPTQIPVAIFSKQDIDQFNTGGYLFLDATWAELNLSLLSGSYQYKQTMYAKNGGKIEIGSETPQSGEGWETMLGLSLLGKYPFTLNERFTVFPLLGIDYQFSLMQRRLKKAGGVDIIYDRTDGKSEMKDSNGDPYKLSAWNALFIVLGGGADYHFAGTPFFIRGELLYSIRLPTIWENDSLVTLKNAVSAPDPKLSGLSSGPTFKIAAGWRFFDK